MKSIDIERRFNEILDSEKFVCTEEEFNNFQNYGYLIPMGKSYLTRTSKKVEVSVIKQSTYRLNLDLSGVIANALQVSKENNFKRIYCMSNNTYNKYMKNGFIIQKNGMEYYRFFDGELWLVMII